MLASESPKAFQNVLVFEISQHFRDQRFPESPPKFFRKAAGKIAMTCSNYFFFGFGRSYVHM